MSYDTKTMITIVSIFILAGIAIPFVDQEFGTLFSTGIIITLVVMGIIIIGIIGTNKFSGTNNN